MKKFRVFTQITVTVEKEIEAADFDEAYRKMMHTTISNEDVAQGERTEEVTFAAEDTSTGQLYDYAN